MIDYIFLNTLLSQDAKLQKDNENPNKNISYFDTKHYNMTIRMYEDKVNIFGSIQKYGIGNNYEDCSYNDCLEYLECLGAETNINLSDFNVFTYEIGANLKTEVAPPHYINNAIKPTIFNEKPYSNKKGLTGKVFGLGATAKHNKDYLQISMYDKISEVKFNKELLKPEYVNANLLRCEVKRLSNVKTKLKLKDRLQVKDLYKNDVKKLILGDAKKNLDKIQIVDFHKIPKFKTAKEFDNICFYLETPDLTKWLSNIETLFIEYDVSQNVRSKIRKKLRERGKGFEIENNSLGAELREKINDKFSKELSETI